MYEETATTICNGTRPGFTTGVIQPVVFDARGNGDGETVSIITGAHENRITDYTSVVAYCIGNGQANDAAPIEEEVCKTLNCMVDPMKVLVAGTKYIVRRLTPLECERLQGYPDGWTNIGEWTDSKGKKHKEADSPRYKALGNSIALPFWKWLLKRISAQYERDATLGSLFDGIGGFPLCWEQINGKGSARWASEIEKFPIAVTKIRFPEVE
jgi:DNA (cytosine-5)-methyltransferase 1